MRPVSDRWAEAIVGAHRIATRVTLLDTGEDLGPAEGRVTLDDHAAIRGRCDLTLIGDGSGALVPDAATSALAPYGNEIQVERGITYPDGTTELVSLGIFRIDESEAVDEGEGAGVRVVGLDRSSRIIDARFEDAGQIASGTTYTTAILGLIQAAYPDVDYSFATSSLTTPTITYEAGGDRWALCQSMAGSMGMELYFDGDGRLVLRPVPTAVEGSSVFDLVEGEGGVLVAAAKRWTREGAYNRVIATGEATSTGAAPVRGVATDSDPDSPTYYYGDFGKVPAFYVSEFLTTTAQANDAAAAQLARQLGTSQQISFGSVVNPALEPSDVVRVTRETLAIDEEHVIDSLSIPLEAESGMTGTTRATQVTG